MLTSLWTLCCHPETIKRPWLKLTTPLSILALTKKEATTTSFDLQVSVSSTQSLLLKSLRALSSLPLSLR
jgi:hypothetical protein